MASRERVPAPAPLPHRFVCRGSGHRIGLRHVHGRLASALRLPRRGASAAELRLRVIDRVLPCIARLADRRRRHSGRQHRDPHADQPAHLRSGVRRPHLRQGAWRHHESLGRQRDVDFQLGCRECRQCGPRLGVPQPGRNGRRGGRVRVSDARRRRPAGDDDPDDRLGRQERGQQHDVHRRAEPGRCAARARFGFHRRV